MPTINCPTGPSTNDTYNLGTRTWRWNGEAWELQPLTGGFTGSQGYTGSAGANPTDVYSLTNTTLSDSLLITTTEDSSTAGPVITLKRNSSSPADADYLGQIKFKGENDADQEIIYAKITAKIDDASDGDEDGIIEITHKKAGANNISARWKSDKLMLINGTSLDVAGDITLSTVNNTTNIKIKDSSGSVLKTMYGTTS